MQSTFATKKREILQQLAEPEGSYANLPVRRSIDVGIRELVDEINDMETLVTTSSCAGRIAVYLESRPSQQSLSTSTSTSTSTTVNSIDTQHLPIDGGQWLFVSHDPLPLSGMGSVAPVLGFSDHTDLTFPSDVEGMRWVRCKFEPMALQVLTSSIESAQKVHAAAIQSGFGESGISSISTDSLRTSTAEVNIRTTNLAFDSVIGYEGVDGKLIPMVTEAYMRVLVELGNQKFIINKQQRERFRSAIANTFRPPVVQASGPCAWEPIEQRRARMMEDGVRRRREAEETGRWRP